jgi:hypothetical protein
MFLVSTRQLVFFFVMLGACAMALTHPAWEHSYRLIFRPRFTALAILGLGSIVGREVTFPSYRKIDSRHAGNATPSGRSTKRNFL